MYAYLICGDRTTYYRNLKDFNPLFNTGAADSTLFADGFGAHFEVGTDWDLDAAAFLVFSGMVMVGVRGECETERRLKKRMFMIKMGCRRIAENGHFWKSNRGG